MKTAIIWLVIGMIIQGLWMQWRFTGTLFSNEIRQEIIDEILIKEFKEKDVLFRKGNCLLVSIKYNVPQDTYDAICPAVFNVNGKGLKLFTPPMNTDKNHEPKTKTS